jgi:hypothetical protein
MLRRDPPIRGQEGTGDWAIWGRDDNDAGGIPIGMSCHVYPDGDGWLIYFTVAGSSQDDREPSSLPWKNANAKLSFCQVTQDGDWERCLPPRFALSSARTLVKSAKRPPPMRSAA